MTARSPTEVLDALYRDVLTALEPARAVRQALDQRHGRGRIPRGLHLLAVGKAAQSMAAGALDWCAAHAVTVFGGVCVSHADLALAVAPLRLLLADHPTPGAASLTAADALGHYVESEIVPDDDVLVLLSGGASALIGAPRDSMTQTEFAATSDSLLGAGLSIDGVNQVRRRLSRWGGGRLGEALQARGARIDVLLISDVIGDDPAVIGSGPCIPPSDDADAQPADAIPHLIISGNRAARRAAATLAAALGLSTTTHDEPLRGDVAGCAQRIASMLLDGREAARGAATGNAPRLHCWGGEPTVTLTGLQAPPGGRMQALALDIAERLHLAGDAARGITVLAAGTDGRDGPTDAAGAIVDAHSWAALLRAGRAPGADRAAFRSHDALASIGALIPSFASGTNVNDLVLALVSTDGPHDASYDASRHHQRLD